MRPAPKASAVELRNRRDDVRALLAALKPRTAICMAVAKKYGCSPRQVGRDIERIFSEWREEEKESRSSLRASVLRRLERLGSKAEEAGNWTAAIAAEAMRMKLIPESEGERFSSGDTWADLFKRALKAKEEREKRRKVTVTIDDHSHVVS